MHRHSWRIVGEHLKKNKEKKIQLGSSQLKNSFLDEDIYMYLKTDLNVFKKWILKKSSTAIRYVYM